MEQNDFCIIELQRKSSKACVPYRGFENESVRFNIGQILVSKLAESNII